MQADPRATRPHHRREKIDEFEPHLRDILHEERMEKVRVPSLFMLHGTVTSLSRGMHCVCVRRWSTGAAHC